MGKAAKAYVVEVEKYGLNGDHLKALAKGETRIIRVASFANGASARADLTRTNDPRISALYQRFGSPKNWHGLLRNRTQAGANRQIFVVAREHQNEFRKTHLP